MNPSTSSDASARGTFCRRTRREFLWEAGAGFTGLALAGLLDGDGFFTRNARALENPLAPKPPHFAPRAKSVIFLFMYGGPSHVDTFDYKPELYTLDGRTIAVKTFGRSGKKNEGRVVGPKWKFQQYGACGKWISDLFPNLATCVDDMAFLHSMTADSPIHGSARTSGKPDSATVGTPGSSAIRSGDATANTLSLPPSDIDFAEGGPVNIRSTLPATTSEIAGAVPR